MKEVYSRSFPFVYVWVCLLGRVFILAGFRSLQKSGALILNKTFVFVCFRPISHFSIFFFAFQLFLFMFSFIPPFSLLDIFCERFTFPSQIERTLSHEWRIILSLQLKTISPWVLRITRLRIARWGHLQYGTNTTQLGLRDWTWLHAEEIGEPGQQRETTGLNGSWFVFFYTALRHFCLSFLIIFWPWNMELHFCYTCSIELPNDLHVALNRCHKVSLFEQPRNFVNH